MPAMTPNKVAYKTFVKHKLTQADTTGNEYKIAVQDPSNVYVLIQPTTLCTGKFKLTVTASTGFPTSKGLGNYVFVSTSTTKPGVTGKPQYILGPFESARFLDISTGGRTIGITVASTSGKAIVANGYLMSSFEILPST
jgi:hypothetical protein